MAYIGNSASVQQYSPTIQYFSGNGSTTAFTLPIPVVTPAQLIVAVDNVIQNPSSAYTVTGSTLTFTSAPLAGTNNIWVEYTSLQTSVNALPQNPTVLGPMYVSINGAAPLGGATNPIVGQSGSANNYVQSYIQNLTNAANSSADFTAYPHNGNDASGWVDMGITGSAYSQATYSVTGPNEAYLFGSSPVSAGTAVTGNLVIATDANGSSNAIQFYTGGFNQAKSAARMTIDGSGNVGIGTTSQGSKLEVKAAGASGTQLQLTQYNSTDGWKINADDNGGPLRFIRQGASLNGEAMRIDNSGNLLVGTTTQKTYSSRILSQNTGVGLFSYYSYSGTGAGASHIGFETANGFCGQITTTGTTTSYGTSSDYRLKENVQPMTGALSTVSQLKPVTYDWIADKSKGQGFIAHELQAIVPDCVTGTKDAVDAEGKPIYQGIDTSFLVATLTAAIQELKAEVDSLKAQLGNK
jgi:hypothetical protein